MKSHLIASGMAASLFCSHAVAQFTDPACGNLAPSDFKASELFNKTGANGAVTSDGSLSEPVQFDLHALRQGAFLTSVDIYFVQRLGAVKRYDGAAKRVTVMGTIPNWGQVDNGLMGLAVHPEFSSNRWTYFWYSPNKLAGQNRLLRLTRITVTPDYRLDMASEKILIEILGSKSDSFHSGGPMTFDRKGDLWITIGNNSPDLNPETLNVLSKTDSTHSAEWGPSNTANMRGGIIRIHPDSSAKGYSIPMGNMGEYWAAEFEKQGRTALAAQYRDPAKVLREIYVKGSRSNYSIAVHPTKGWVAWGEVNYSNIYDEYNLVARPSFAGYPYFHSGNLPTGAHGKSITAPVNNSPFNNGVTELPPAVPGLINNLANTAISGPMYVFDSTLKSEVKFPPQMNQTWATFSWVSHQMHIHNLDAFQPVVLKTTRADNALFSNLKLRRPLQARYGPEGALYVLNLDGSYNNTINPSVTRVDYVGGCKVPVTSRREAGRPETDLGIFLTPASLRVLQAVGHEITLQEVSGAVRLRRSGTQAAEYVWKPLRLETGLDKGVYVLRVKTAKGALIRTITLL